jgi:sulfatase maturation enzyme AslB (radical SAM superfamily)
MKDCYGTIYPDVSRLQLGSQLAGKVFRVRIDTLGGGQRDRHLEADLSQWQECQQCETFRSCYDFSTAKLALQQAVSAI